VLTGRALCVGRTIFFMWTIHRFTELPSTNAYARKLLGEAKARHGDVFQAEHQTEGRGRLADRVWKDEPGSSLLLTFVLTHFPRECLNIVQFMAALSVASAVRSLLKIHLNHFASERIRLKWPNDILFDGKKIAGILAEAVWTGDELRGVAVGIGLNINQRDFPEELTTATSLAVGTDRKYSVEQVRDYVLSEIQSYLLRCKHMPHELMASSVISELRRELTWMQSLPPFSLDLLNGEKLENVQFAGVGDDGALMARTPDGERALHAASLNLMHIDLAAIT
jgi:BirA family transcriptional regulator, biotin operon repressor / biotin---[acetyl-CoA-carboxylase] ligase